jgi:hypothetical protein
MRKLEPLIARFIDNVLRLVEQAAADGLRTLLAEEARRPRARRPDADLPAAARPSEDLPRDSGRPVRKPAKRSPIAIVTADPTPPAPGAEITDPQWVLAMGAPAPLEVGDAADFAGVAETESASEGPVSTVRETAHVSPVRLRANETLARVSGAGVVIRRAR